MRLGKGIGEGNAAKLLAKMGQAIEPGEEIVFVFKCANFKPSVDRLVITDRRLLAVNSPDGVVKFSADRAALSATAADAWSGPALAVEAGGRSAKFAQLDLDDRAAAVAILSGQQPDPPAAPAEAPEATGFGARMRKAKDDADAAAARRLAEAADRKVEVARDYGELVHRDSFGGCTIEVYGKGYVRVAVFMGSGTPYERVRSVSARHIQQDKSAGGRALASMATGGVSKLFSNEHRIAFLTISTDRKAHALQQTGGGGDRRAFAVEAAINGVLDALRHEAAAPSAPAPAPASSSPTAADRLRQLADLHKDGLLSDEEFAAAKARLLEEL